MISDDGDIGVIRCAHGCCGYGADAIYIQGAFDAVVDLCGRTGSCCTREIIVRRRYVVIMTGRTTLFGGDGEREGATVEANFNQ
jgi:hypothetical protein